jgi:hypothetical protein
VPGLCLGGLSNTARRPADLSSVIVLVHHRQHSLTQRDSYTHTSCNVHHTETHVMLLHTSQCNCASAVQVPEALPAPATPLAQLAGGVPAGGAVTAAPAAEEPAPEHAEASAAEHKREQDERELARKVQGLL